MYDLIEHQIAPRFYDRGDDGVPTRWVQSIRHTLSTLSPALSADRMVREYVERLYLPAAAAERRMLADSAAGARELAAWKARLVEAWPRISVPYVESGGVDVVPQVGDTLHVRAQVNLDGLSPDDVSVQVVHGRARDGDELVDPQYTELAAVPGQATAPSGRPGAARGAVQFAGTVTLARAGNFGYNVRVVPRHPLLASAAELGLIAVAH